jgi:hypothetical protein
LVPICLVYGPTLNKETRWWIGVAKDVSDIRTYWILPTSYRPIARSSVTSLTQEKLDSPRVKEFIAYLDASISEKIGVQ